MSQSERIKLFLPALALSIVVTILQPINDMAGIVLFFLGFALIIVIAHKAAFRANRLGFLLIYKNPGALFSVQFNKFETAAMVLSTGLIAGFLIGVLCLSIKP